MGFRNPIVAAPVVVHVTPQAAYTPSVGQVAVGTVATAISGAGSGRSALTLYNPSANTESVFLSFSDAVTTADGYELDPGYGVTIGANAQVWAVASASTTVSFEDE